MSSHIAISSESGQVYVAGPNTNGQLSLGTTTQTNTFTLGRIDPSTNISGVIQTSVGSAHTLMLRSTGTAYSCGLNTNGQLGLGTTIDTSFVDAVLSSDSATLGNITAVAAGASHSLFLLSDGSALACGLNTSNQLGDGTAIQRTYPVNVLRSAGVFLNPVSSIAGGTSHSVFATTDGSAWSCGLNTNNQLGDGTTTTRAFATQVRTGVSTFLSNVNQIAAGESHSLALTNAGTVFGWGRNNSGQLALGTTVDSAYATQCLFALATPMTGIVSIASHANHSLFLTASGTVLSCGLNTNGQLGDGTTTNRSYPVVVSTATGVPLTDIVSIGTAANQSYFIKADGRVYACGNGQTGGLGNGGVADSSFAVLVLSGSQNTMKSFGYSAAYWRSQGVSASTLVNGGGYGAYDLVNGGYNKTDLSNAGFSITTVANAGIQDLYALGYSHNEIVNGTNVAVTKIGQLSVAGSKIGTLMSGGLLDAPRSVTVSGRDASSISVAISGPGFSTGLTGYSVSAVPVTGGSTVAKSLGVVGTLVDGLATGKIYDLQVRSVGANGNSAATVVRNSTTFTLPTLSTGNITSTSIVVNFSSALAIQDCSYALRTVPEVTRYILAPGTTSQSMTGLLHSTTYSIILDASNAFTSSSTNISATTLTSPVLWLDANMNVVSSSGKVSSWGDRSSNNYSASQSNTSLQPNFSANFLGTNYPGIDFTNSGATGGWLLETNQPSTTVNDLTMFLVLKRASSATRTNSALNILSSQGSWQTGSIHIFYERVSSKFRISINSSNTDYTSNLLIQPGNSYIVVINVTSTGGCISTTRINGTAATSSHTHSSSVVALRAFFEIGGWKIDNSRTMDGGISELIQYNRTLTTSQIEYEEGKLAWKWGLNSNLPVGHPYKNAAPT